MTMQAHAVDLFCGAGGLAHGLKLAGISVVGGIDVDPDCKFPFEQNNASKFILQDLATLSAEHVATLFPPKGPRILVGCAPCQPFSRYARGNRPVDHDRWSLLSHFLRLVMSVLPEIVSVENVPELQREDIFRRFVEQLTDCGYDVSCQNVFCPDYGIPQQRTRLILLASRRGKITLQPPTNPCENRRTVRQTIENLPPLQAGQECERDPMHRSSRLTDINLLRIKCSIAGGTWRDWPSDLVSECHNQDSGKTYPSVYGRMEWDKPSPTITTQFFGYGNGRFGHPSQHRAISLREGSLLQSFPFGYQFAPKSSRLSFAKLGRMIGNAVPVRLGEILGESIMKHLEES